MRKNASAALSFIPILLLTKASANVAVPVRNNRISICQNDFDPLEIKGLRISQNRQMRDGINEMTVVFNVMMTVI